MLKRILLFCLLFGNVILAAQNGTSSVAGARGLAMGDASVAFQDINSAFSNQAGLSGLKNTEATVFAEQRFQIQEIRSLAAAVAYPTASGVFSLNLGYFGFDDFNEQRIGLAYSRKLLAKLALGAQINYLNFSIPEYGNKGLMSFEIGLQSEIVKNFIIAAHLVNPIGQTLVEGEELPTVFSFGLMTRISDQLLLSGEVEKDIDFDIRTKIGLEYKLIEALMVRLGVATEPAQYSFGMGYLMKEKLRIDVAANYQQQLGFSPGLSISYSF